ncbi:ABC transporter, ATP-binding protein [Proteus mirabilis]|uniref:ABC-type dipeptide transporter n=1 Tax=Proteus mirabilis TaxID=584 RepID=A0A2X2BGR6_PROMI|nr:ABC transporter, ATP-binding protein [Proteus mirabilis]
MSPFQLGQERLALVGESGSGKSMTARSLMGLVRKPGKVSADKLHFMGDDLLAYSPKQWNQLRGKTISMVLQDPRYALNPVKNHLSASRRNGKTPSKIIP